MRQESSLRTRIARAANAASLIGGLALALAACGGGGTTEEEATAEVARFEATGSGKDVAVKGPKTVPGGVAELELVNEAEAPVSLQLVTADGDYSEEEVSQMLEVARGGKEPVADWFHAAGGIAPTEPGETATVVQELEPGTYYGYNDEGDASVPAVTFEVSEDGEGELPETDATITATEYSFGAEGLTAGKNRVLFENDGAQWHHAIAFPIKEGNTIEDVTTFLETEEGEPPFDEAGIAGTAVIDGGKSQVVDLDLDSGRYALVCFVTDREGGEPHVAQGMVTEAEVE